MYSTKMRCNVRLVYGEQKSIVVVGVNVCVCVNSFHEYQNHLCEMCDLITLSACQVSVYVVFSPV